MKKRDFNIFIGSIVVVFIYMYVNIIILSKTL